jgi:hypothetical protein
MHRVGTGVRVGVRVFVGVSVGRGVGVSDADTEGEEVGEGVGDGTAADGTGVKLAVGVGLAAGGVAVSVAVGSTWAISCCSPIPRATATRRVRAIRVAAISPLKSGPNPPAVLPFPWSSSGIILPLQTYQFNQLGVCPHVHVCNPARQRKCPISRAAPTAPIRSRPRPAGRRALQRR